MSEMTPDSLYNQLGVRPVLNAMGNVTMLGGSNLSPGVLHAMQEANHIFVSMEELLEKSGEAIAGMLGAESVFVTSGAYAALVLGIAGIMTGDDADAIERLPDTTGLKNEILIQKRSRYHYDRCITAAGAKMVEVGDENGTSADQLRAAIGPSTAGILYFARMEGEPGILSIEEVVKIAHAAGIRVILDAAGEVYPLDRIRSLPRCGADLVCFGAKYLGSANSSGILCGDRHLVQAARLSNFVSYESKRNRAMGRGFKVDRQEVIGTMVALREWLEMDHEERLHGQAVRIETILQALKDVPNIQATNAFEQEDLPWMRLRIVLEDGLGKTAQQVADELRAGDPSIWVRVEGDDIYVVVHTLREGEEATVGARLRDVLQDESC